MKCVKSSIIFKRFFQMKKFPAALALSPAALFAAEDGSVAYNGSVAETIVTDASTTLTDFLTGVGPVVAGIVVAGLVFWGVRALVRIIDRFFRSSLQW